MNLNSLFWPFWTCSCSRERRMNIKAQRNKELKKMAVLVDWVVRKGLVSHEPQSSWYQCMTISDSQASSFKENPFVYLTWKSAGKVLQFVCLGQLPELLVKFFQLNKVNRAKYYKLKMRTMMPNSLNVFVNVHFIFYCWHLSQDFISILWKKYFL